MLKIYLDNCCYNRPFDDLSFERNRLEANAKIFIQSLVKYKSVMLYYSFMSQIEVDDNPFEENKACILNFINENASGFIGKNHFTEIEELAAKIINTGIKKKDATHLACAILAKCNYFITTDDRVLKYKTDEIEIVNPIKFIEIWRTF
ncbi:MAG: hypothetical protein FWF08_06130 [Oscillospiraceae bacterium]|nr:hypothetical protein [Oscillospiraceae bacterium]